MLDKENIKKLYDTKFLHIYDLQYEEGKHYYNASRRTIDELAAAKTDEEFKNMYPDAVSCFVILERKGKEPALLLSYEYRYPAGRYLLSVPAGLLDENDKKHENPLISAAVREIREETGLSFKDGDFVKVVNPLAFSTPGMTDESNALVFVLFHLEDDSELSQEGAEGSEQFAGFELLDKAEALKILQSGTDKYGNYYPIFTWAALMYFVSEMWKQ